MSTNHELARAAFVLLARYSVGNVSPTDFEGAVKIISDTYAEPMAELERLRSGGWIRCSERMPDVGELVLTWNGETIHVDWVEGDETWNEQDYVIPTHWQPLPEPPEEAT